MTFTFRKSRLVSYASALLLLCTAASAQQADRANVTFNLRVKVEGNVAAINTGIDVICRLLFEKPDGTAVESRGRMNFLQAGETFAPRTADGFIEGQITLENAPIGLDAGYALGSDNMAWVCRAVHQSKGPGQAQGFLNFGAQAVRPAYIGTCSEVFGGLNLDGVVTEIDPSCAAY
ncbi:hypothetical protein ACMAZE_01355 [Pseudopelagicola sp. nBUS_20]|uniref:hypothetical protein n=1 Tax=Pseudopelagicola sp. nBUS_20 TaxID=3395317 RepID=UPI003EBED51F